MSSGKNAGKNLVSNRRIRGLISCMNIQVAVLCDAATDDNGKLNLLGAFDTIFAPQLPAVHPQCAVALRVTFVSGDEGERKLKLNFVNADGKSIMPPIDIPVAVALPDDAHFVTRNATVHCGYTSGICAAKIVSNVPRMLSLLSRSCVAASQSTAT